MREAEAEAFRAGAEAMREAAAVRADDGYRRSKHLTTMCLEVANAIRALSLPEPPTAPTEEKEEPKP